GEYSSGMIRTTLAAMPRRTTVLAAKAALVTGLTLAAGTLAILGSLLAGRLILPGQGFTAVPGFAPPSLAGGPGLRPAARSGPCRAVSGTAGRGRIAAAHRPAAAARDWRVSRASSGASRLFRGGWSGLEQGGELLGVGLGVVAVAVVEQLVGGGRAVGQVPDL